MQDTKTVYGSTETFPWGGSETTYYVNGQVIGFSESHSDAGAAAGTSRRLVVIAAAMRHILIRTIIGW